MVQCLLLIHQTNLDHDKAGQNCELCLHAASLDSMHASVSAALLPEFFGNSEPAYPRIINAVTRIYSAIQARAPPSLL
jgi:hypothetical protein